jgi:hypothetical protein
MPPIFQMILNLPNTIIDGVSEGMSTPIHQLNDGIGEIKNCLKNGRHDNDDDSSSDFNKLL